ncbi:MAG: YggS family pyridoxal phosphate-dependent enzyme [Bacteroidetes bacterium]|nr:YggS family pyridoxal phosphate-dependent enzyme [Bacteroidota bacterium]MBS1628931.1 YggS family pyridoxal phosphate-dependent enzyme [Bacteroidota bacterium]
MIQEEFWKELCKEIQGKARLVAVSKTKPAADILALYELGQRDFGENYVQELTEKATSLPSDILWHFIGHLQRNKVKYIAPFVHLIHGVDSFPLLLEINKQAAKNNRVIDVLMQMHIADEETKFGMDERDIIEFLQYYEAQRNSLSHVRIRGLMGMATATEDPTKIHSEFIRMRQFFMNLKKSEFLAKSYFDTCSMGMSGDYQIALDAGSTMLRIGSLLFGSR